MLQGVAFREEPRQRKLAWSRRKLGSALTRFGFTSAMLWCRERPDRKEASANTTKTTLRRWSSSAACRVWDSLSEIRGLLKLRGNRLQPCAPVRRRLEEKLAEVQRKLADLNHLEDEL